jgi:DNA-binding MarR family transcriptional regulator
MANERAVRRPGRAQKGPTITYLVGRVERALRRRLQECLSPFKLSVAQYTTLSVLHAGGDEVSNARLASRAFITPQAMNEVVQGLEARKLITRRAAASHGRIVQLLLTDSGLEILQNSHAAVRDLEQSMLGELSASERTALTTALTSCAHALEGSGQAEGLRPRSVAR